MIEQQIYEHLQSCDVLQPYLTTYAGRKAIFNQEAPADTDPLWGPGSQYGRLVTEMSLKGDPERSIAGTLNLHYYCEKSRQAPEDAEPVIRPLIDGYFFCTDDVAISADWKSSNYITAASEKIIGVTVSFSLIAYPKQEAMPPGPVALINAWSTDELSKLLDKNLYVVGSEEVPQVFKPDQDHPAIYWRMTGVSKCSWIPDTWAGSWQTASLRGHILAAGSDGTELFIARLIDHVLTNKKRLVNEEMSMFVDRNNVINLAADPQRVGQITVEGTYGVPNMQPEVLKMNNISMEPRI